MTKVCCIALTLIFVYTNPLQAQKIQKKIASDACICMDKISTDAAKAERDRAMEACIQHAALDNRAAIDEELGLTLDGLKEKNGQAFIKDISARLLKDCDAFAEMVRTDAEPERKAVAEKPEKKTKPQKVEKSSQKGFRTITKKGTLVSVENKIHTYVFFKDKNGIEHQLLWFSYFEGAEKLIESFDTYVGKEIEITWQEKRVYDSIEKRYGREKEISAIKL